jgi:hypothetical protein
MHKKAADQHDQAAKSHRTAAEQHGMGDHAKAQQHASNAQIRIEDSA